jgi:transcriptional regulator with XRE-family HTH domain
MKGATLIREARKRRGITQGELARRLSTTQSAVARLEAGATAPRFETVLAAVRACDLDLHISIGEPDRDHRRLIDDALSVTPAQRLDDLVGRLDAEDTLRRARKAT